MADAPPICSRMPSHIADMLDADCAQQGLSRTEVINAIMEGYYFGGAALQGADEGYKQARRIAPQLARRMLARAFDDMPETYEEALAVLQQPR